MAYRKTMKNFHVPLPEETYEHLKAAAAHSKVPATTLAREAIDFWLRQRLRKARRDAIAAFAAEVAGTSLDLDDDLEAAAVEHLVRTGKASKAHSECVARVKKSAQRMRCAR
ncbi:MAG TPA: hypothetical protein VIX91_19590 [Candidatus Acidoferrum sp.]